MPSEFPWHDIILNHLPELRLCSTPSSMSLRQSLIFHLISLELGACTSLGNHLGEGEVVIQNTLVHWANKVSEKIGTSYLLMLRTACFRQVLSEGGLWHVLVVFVSDHFKCCLEYSCTPKRPVHLHTWLLRVFCHILSGDFFFNNENTTMTGRLSTWNAVATNGTKLKV